MRFVQFAKEKFTLYTKMRLKVLFFSNAKLSGAIFSDADLKEANLLSTNLSGARFCKIKVPWGELNDHCED